MKPLFVAVIALLLAYLLFWPVPISPQSWTPPDAPATDAGPFAVNQRLKAAEVLAVDAGVGPEGLAFDDEGMLYTGYLDGRVVKLDPASGALTELANTGGRPLGMVMTEAGLVVADAINGLLRIAADGTVTTLSTQSDARPFRFVDDVDVAPDGRLYFSDASHRYGADQLMHDFFEHAGTGRLLRHDPATGITETLVDGLHFANGVAVGPNGDYVLVTETGRYQVTRYWLNGPQSGTTDVFIDNLPGFPDNISYDDDGRFWLALYAPRDPVLDLTLPQPWLRKVLFRLPQWMHPEPKPYAAIVALDTEGRVVANAQASGPDVFAPVTSVKRRGDALFLGSLSYPGVARLPVSAVTAD